MTYKTLNIMTDKSRNWLERLSTLIAREPQDKEQLLEILHDAEDRDILSPDMLGMIQRILQVSEMQVRDVMVPKVQMIVVEKNIKLEELLPLVIESGHSRFPVIDPNNKDILGILLAKDILQHFTHTDKKPFDINQIIRPAVFAPQSKRLDILLREFRVNRNHIAIVLDEYSHVSGLVTIEDVLEQIVGDIEDEYDIDEDDVYMKQLNDGTYIVKAQTPIEEFNNYFGAEFSDSEFDTIGGIVLREFGHLPKRNEMLKIDQWRFKVLHSDNRRIYLMEVKLVKKKDHS